MRVPKMALARRDRPAPHSCGLGPFRPRWLQRLANTKCFLIIYGLTGSIQAMSHIYTSATLTTLEKRFKIPSRIIGVLMSGNEVSQILLSVVMAYHGGRGNRPLWMAWGVVFSGLSSYILALPHLLYGPGEEALSLTEEFLDLAALNSSDHSRKEKPLLCTTNRTLEGMCSQADSSGEYSWTPLVLIFLSQFVLGIGITLVHALGQTYIDDHTEKSNTPILLGVYMSLRMLGPAVGFAFSSFCLSLYIDPTLTPVIQRKDPRWLGAWWLGWLVLGTVKIVFGVLLAFFPKELPPKENKKAVEGGVDPSATDAEVSGNKPKPQSNGTIVEKDTAVSPGSEKQADQEGDGFYETMVRLLKNKILMSNIFAAIFFIIGGSGSMTFSMKYLETQYHVSAAGASMLAGTTTLLAMVVGFLVSGLVIGKFKPRPRLILGWNVVLGFVSVAGYVSYVFLRCEDRGLHGLDVASGATDFVNECNVDCGCANVRYQPVCDVEKDVTFYSPCHIGCRASRLDPNGTKTVFTHCDCAPGARGADLPAGDDGLVVANGPCAVDCSRVIFVYIAIGFVVHVLGSSGRIGNVLVNFRCVSQKDKVVAQGFGLMLLSLFAFIPGPIIFGAIIDSTCLEWDSSCGSKGNCWLYHKDKFRLYFNVTAVALTTLGTLLDLVVWYLGARLDLYGEQQEPGHGAQVAEKYSQLDLGDDLKARPEACPSVA
ncbi:solute carrier organic anion transporter family member 74D-like [Bacillus rossius redtenbacheri]|uniref:solute carrier organic anion transporter family member 74D-like n=1 Tax=Bacillus rossius redtenbacheri TaxID=93214 RepID=UPI002FDD3AB2